MAQCYSQWLVTVACGATLFIDVLIAQFPLAFLPQFLDALGFSSAHISVLFSIAWWASIAAMLAMLWVQRRCALTSSPSSADSPRAADAADSTPAAAPADAEAQLASLRWRGALLMGATVLEAGSTAACSFCDAMAAAATTAAPLDLYFVLLSARVLAGVASGLVWVAALALVTELFASPAARSLAIAIALAGGSLGEICGPMIGGPLYEQLGFRGTFLLVAAAGGVVTLFCLIALSVHAAVLRRHAADADLRVRVARAQLRLQTAAVAVCATVTSPSTALRTCRANCSCAACRRTTPRMDDSPIACSASAAASPLVLCRAVPLAETHTQTVHVHAPLSQTHNTHTQTQTHTPPSSSPAHTITTTHTITAHTQTAATDDASPPAVAPLSVSVLVGDTVAGRSVSRSTSIERGSAVEMVSTRFLFQQPTPRSGASLAQPSPPAPDPLTLPPPVLSRTCPSPTAPSPSLSTTTISLWTLMRDPLVVRPSCAVLLCATGRALVDTMTPLFMENQLQAAPAAIGLSFGVEASAYVGGTLLGGLLLSRLARALAKHATAQHIAWRARWLDLCMLLLFAGACSVMYLSRVESLVRVALAVAGLAVGLNTVTASTIATERSRELGATDAGLTMFNVLWNVGLACGSTLAGCAAAEDAFAQQLALWAISGLVAAFALLQLSVTRSVPVAASEGEGTVLPVIDERCEA